MKLLPDTGLVGLAYWELGFRNLTNNRHPVDQARRHQGLEDPYDPVADPDRAVQQSRRQCGAAALYRALYGARNRHCGRPGKPGSQYPKRQILRSAEVHDGDPSPVQSADRADQQEVLGRPQRRGKGGVAVGGHEARDYQRKVSREQDAKAIAEIKATGMEVDRTQPGGDTEAARSRQADDRQVQCRNRPETVDALFKELNAARGQ